MINRMTNLTWNLNGFLLCHKCVSFGQIDWECPTKETWPPKENYAPEGKKDKSVEQVQNKKTTNSMGLEGLGNSGEMRMIYLNQNPTPNLLRRLYHLMSAI